MNASLKISERTNLLVRFSVTALALSVFITSCTTNQKQPVVVNPDLNRSRITEKQSQANNVEQRILGEYYRWKGTHHRLGGTSRQGIDCSGFVKAVYKDAFNITPIPGRFS
jgi:cell wall-associated NlpC family hydrolase